jgi:hypothetical protein
MLLAFAFRWQHNRRATTKPPHKAVIDTTSSRKNGNRKSHEKSKIIEADFSRLKFRGRIK